MHSIKIKVILKLWCSDWLIIILKSLLNLLICDDFTKHVLYSAQKYTNIAGTTSSSNGISPGIMPPLSTNACAFLFLSLSVEANSSLVFTDLGAMPYSAKSFCKEENYNILVFKSCVMFY